MADSGQYCFGRAQERGRPVPNCVDPMRFGRHGHSSTIMADQVSDQASTTFVRHCTGNPPKAPDPRIAIQTEEGPADRVFAAESSVRAQDRRRAHRKLTADRPSAEWSKVSLTVL
ncbi:hypothetical protein GCM10009551_040340 [Nocardiopsis tropica]